MHKTYFRRPHAGPLLAAIDSDAGGLIDLMLQFESLGAVCEFGMVQRICGAEPLSLFRFSGSKIEKLILLLEDGLDDFLTLQDLKIGRQGVEHMLLSRKYDDFYFHTNRRIEEGLDSSLLSRQVAISAFLKKRFLNDWMDGARIYVHSGCDDEPAILKLRNVLRRRSECTLLWIVQASGGKMPGSVERIGDGLLKGYLGYYGAFDYGPQLDIASWVRVCHRARALVFGGQAREPQPGRKRRATFEWQPTSNAVCETTSIHGRCLLVQDTPYMMPVVGAQLTAVFDAKRFVTASLWIKLSETFEASKIDITIDGVTVICHRRADPSKRDVWQHLWVVAKTTQAGGSMRLEIRIEKGKALSSFDFAGWQIQDGSIADRSCKPDDHQTFRSGRPARARRAPLSRGIANRLRAVAALIEAKSASTPGVDAPIDGLPARDILRIGDALMHAGLFAQADAIIRVGVDLYPWDTELRSHYALNATWAGRFADAAERWAALQRLAPHIAIGHYNLAASHRASGEIARALVIIEDGLKRFSTDACMLAEAARVFDAAGRPRDALVHWDRALAIVHDQAEWRQSRAATAQSLSMVVNPPVPLS